MRYDELLARLEGVRPSGDGHTATCPAHEDQRQSLSVRDTPERLLVYCHAGCEVAAIVAALGVTMAALFHEETPRQSARIVTTYDYTDEEGRLLFQVVRYDPKTFKQRQPAGTGWKWTIAGVPRVLYRLKRLKEHA